MFSSPFPDVDIPDVSLYDYLFGGLEEADLDRIAVVDGTSGAETSYRTLVGQIDAVAGAVAARGLGVHGVAAILCPNVPAFAVVFHGLLRAGATVTTVNSLYTEDEIALQLADAGRGVDVYRLGPAPRGPGSRHPGRDPGRTDRRPRRRRRPPVAAGPADRRRPGAGRQL